jgi:cold shock protein
MFDRHVRPIFSHISVKEYSMADGTIKTITDRGFGFIQPASGREDVFFHRTALVDVTLEQLRQGDRVTYTAENDPRGKGPRASGVRLVTE